MAPEGLFDLIIIGGGPTGLAAAIYAARAELRTLVLEKALPGGQVQNTMAVENYPGFPEVSGFELAERFHEHARKFGAEIRIAAVTKVSYDGDVRVTTDSGDLLTHAALIATGAHPRFLDVPGEQYYRERGGGVSYCAVCDGAFYKEKSVVVIGGGDAALEEGVYLTRFASSVTIVHRRDSFRAQRILQERAKHHAKISFIWNSVVEEVLGDGQRVTGVRIRNLVENQEYVHPADGVFVYIGMVPNTHFLQSAVELDEQGFIKADCCFRTSLPGVFAAGDVRSGSWRQIITVAAEGALAVREIEHFLAEEQVAEPDEIWQQHRAGRVLPK